MTGAGSGIGSAIARLFGAHGRGSVSTFGVAPRRGGGRPEIGRNAGEARAFQCDLRDAAAAPLVSSFVRRLAASTSLSTTPAALPSTTIPRPEGIGVEQAFTLNAAALSFWRATRSRTCAAALGRILYISTAAIITRPNSLHYTVRNRDGDRGARTRARGRVTTCWSKRSVRRHRHAESIEPRRYSETQFRKARGARAARPAWTRRGRRRMALSSPPTRQLHHGECFTSPLATERGGPTKLSAVFELDAPIRSDDRATWLVLRSRGAAAPRSRPALGAGSVS